MFVRGANCIRFIHNRKEPPSDGLRDTNQVVSRSSAYLWIDPQGFISRQRRRLQSHGSKLANPSTHAHIESAFLFILARDTRLSIFFIYIYFCCLILIKKNTIICEQIVKNVSNSAVKYQFFNLNFPFHLSRLSLGDKVINET